MGSNKNWDRPVQAAFAVIHLLSNALLVWVCTTPNEIKSLQKILLQ